MSVAFHNYRRRRSWAGTLPLLLCCLAPLGLMGVAVTPALRASGLEERLESARERAAKARGVRSFLGDFDAAGPPTERFRHIQSLLKARLPGSFEGTQFYRTALTAARGLDLNLESIVARKGQDLGLPVDDLSVFEHHAVLKGQARADALTAFLESLHREGHPVCVHHCSLNALTNRPGMFDFQMDLGVFYLAAPDHSDDLPTEGL